MPALPEMPNLLDMQTLSSLAILPDCVPPVPNVIAVYQKSELGRAWAWCLVLGGVPSSHSMRTEKTAPVQHQRQFKTNMIKRAT